MRLMAKRRTLPGAANASSGARVSLPDRPWQQAASSIEGAIDCVTEALTAFKIMLRDPAHASITGKTDPVLAGIDTAHAQRLFVKTVPPKISRRIDGTLRIWLTSTQISSATNSGSASSTSRLQDGEACTTTVSPRAVRPGFKLLRATQRSNSDRSKYISFSGRTRSSRRSISDQQGEMRTQDNWPAISSSGHSRSCAWGDGRKRLDRCPVVEPNPPTLLCLRQCMNDPARVDSSALRQRTQDGRHHWNSNRLVGDRRSPVALLRRLADFPTGHVTRLNKFSDEAPENAGVTGDVLSAMIVWHDANTHGRYTATDAAVGFEIST